MLKPGGRFVVSDIVAEHALPEGGAERPRGLGRVLRRRFPRVATWRPCAAGGFDDFEVLSRSEPLREHGVWLRSLTLRATKADGAR